MKITMYELLKMNKNDLPKKIKFNEKIWRLAGNKSYFIGSDYGYDFWVEHGDDKFEDEPITLNDEVEILEEEKKIPEKFKVHSLGAKDENGNFFSSPFPTDEEFMNKINEIIDCLDYLKSKGE